MHHVTHVLFLGSPFERTLGRQRHVRQVRHELSKFVDGVFVLRGNCVNAVFICAQRLAQRRRRVEICCDICDLIQMVHLAVSFGNGFLDFFIHQHDRRQFFAGTLLVIFECFERGAPDGIDE